MNRSPSWNSELVEGMIQWAAPFHPLRNVPFDSLGVARRNEKGREAIENKQAVKTAKQKQRQTIENKQSGEMAGSALIRISTAYAMPCETLRFAWRNEGFDDPAVNDAALEKLIHRRARRGDAPESAVRALLDRELGRHKIARLPGCAKAQLSP